MANPILPRTPLAPGPATHAFAITPGAEVFTTATRYLWVGSAGDVTAMLTGDAAAVTFAAVPAGTTLEISVKQVTAFSGDAGTLIGLY